MAFNQQTFTFDPPFGAPLGILTSPLTINYAYPGLLLVGSETNGVTVAAYENAGDLWLVTNAVLTNGNWSQPNTLLPSQALVIRGATSQQQQLTAVAGGLPTPGWQSPSTGGGGGSGTIGTNTLQWGTQNTVPADGSSEVNVSFGSAFASSVAGVTATVVNTYQVTPLELTVQVNTFSLTGFKLNVAGGTAGSTVSVFWMAIGQ